MAAQGDPARRGLKALHDELGNFAEETERARLAGAGTGPREAFDGYAFTVSLKAVLLEGLEVVFIVLTFGANQHRVGLAAIAAAAGRPHG